MIPHPMGWDFLDIVDMPEPGDLVWCKWPHKEKPGVPGPVARPTLVRETAILEEGKTGIQYGAITISYGTGEYGERHIGWDLIIGPHARAKALGLHKTTRIALDSWNRKTLIWCSEFFVPPDYMAKNQITIGRLEEPEIEQMRRCLAARATRRK